MLRQHDARLPEQHFQKIRFSYSILQGTPSKLKSLNYSRDLSKENFTSNSEQHSSAHAKSVDTKVTKFILRQGFKQFQVDFMFHKQFFKRNKQKI